MVKILGLVALATFCGASAASCQSAPPARTRPADSDGIRPPPLEDPAAVPGWMAHAIDHLLSDPGDQTDDGRRR